MDHFSDFTYAHLMTTLDAKLTTEAKEALERLSLSHGVKVQHSHANNDIFNARVFKASV